MAKAATAQGLERVRQGGWGRGKGVKERQAGRTLRETAEMGSSLGKAGWGRGKGVKERQGGHGEAP